MNINKILKEYDNMFGIKSLEEIENFLKNKINESYDEEDYSSSITLLNEIIGFCRDTGQKDKGISYCKQVTLLLDDMKLNGTVGYAISILNVANCYRAFGMFNDSLKLYENVEDIYKNEFSKNDFHYASLYNNWGILYQEMKKYEDAKELLTKALYIVDQYPEAIIEQAVTRTNLAAVILKMDEKQEFFDLTMQYLQQAIDIFEMDGGKDFHYSASLSAMGDALHIKHDYSKSAFYYKKAMEELEKHVGKSQSYERVLEKYKNAIEKKSDIKNTGEDVSNVSR